MKIILISIIVLSFVRYLALGTQDNFLCYICKHKVQKQLYYKNIIEKKYLCLLRARVYLYHFCTLICESFKSQLISKQRLFHNFLKHYDHLLSIITFKAKYVTTRINKNNPTRKHILCE